MKILHCHSTFNLGGKEARAVRLMNAFGDAAQHTILSAVPDALNARDAIEPGIKVDFPADAPSLIGKPAIGRYRTLSAYMKRFDLVLSYNWGSMDVVGARRLFPSGCPPLIHHEDGFNLDEAVKLNWKRSAYRRLMLPTAKALVVPSQKLEAIARDSWRRTSVRIPNGINISAYAVPPAHDAVPGFTRSHGDIIIGTLAGLRAVKNLPKLVRAFATLPTHAKLVIIGEGPERAAIMAEAKRLSVADRIIMPGFLAAPHRYIGLFDIFALSSDSEQFPISLVEAMAAGLPIVSTDVGDVRAMVAEPARPFVVPVSDEATFAARLGELVADQDLRARIGAANQALAVADYDEDVMISRYAKLYGIKA